MSSENAKRVLIVDDSSTIRVLMRHILENEGYEVHELKSAHELETTVETVKPSLVISDLMMPGRDGIAVCRALRAMPEFAELPIILASSKAFESDKKAAAQAGANAYLVKPFTYASLVKAVGDALSTQLSVRIWGCRGSIAAPEKALGKYGGNTSCIELVLPGNQHLIFDAGTGIRALGNALVQESPLRAAVFLTHFHWDHIQGMPFFKPIYIPGNEFHLYGPAESNEALLDTIAGQIGGPFFPISPDAFRASMRYNGVQEQELEALGIKITTLYVMHPGTTLGYRVDINGHSVVFAPDNELMPEMVEPELSGEAQRFADFAAGADLLIHDCQYSSLEYERYRGWGHSSAHSLGIVAAAAGVKSVLTFHHDPDHSDEDIDRIHLEFAATAEAMGANIQSEPAREGGTYSF